MLADFYIPRFSNDMKNAVQKSFRGSNFFTEVWKNGVYVTYIKRFFNELVALGRLFARSSQFWHIFRKKKSLKYKN